ncbi:MAG: hypothetical protein RQ899_00765 [Pseudomonadales bacterium]|nr:hypothetical protein [Pseudomonadales bacterium]
MANTRKAEPKKNNAHPRETSQSIEEQTARFLASGGTIQEIPRGVSGQVATSGPRHITLGKRNTAS